jgi:hypothetical protein
VILWLVSYIITRQFFSPYALPFLVKEVILSPSVFFSMLATLTFVLSSRVVLSTIIADRKVFGVGETLANCTACINLFVLVHLLLLLPSHI